MNGSYLYAKFDSYVNTNVMIFHIHFSERIVVLSSPFNSSLRHHKRREGLRLSLKDCVAQSRILLRLGFSWIVLKTLGQS
ncbi:MAG: hypothetical protein QW099_04910, partial [Candidatus Bathyarchaeia archaeon]